MSPSRAHLSGSRIRDLRLDRGIRQADLARMAGISAPYLNLIEHNRRRIGGKLLLDIARALRVEPAVLSEGAAASQIAVLRDAAADMSGSVAETERTAEFAGRFPGWAGLIAAQARRIASLERQVETLNDRLAHDPFLSAALHDVLTTVTAIRSTSAILDGGDEIDPEWRARFHRNLHEDSRRLAESSRSLVAYLDAAEDADRRRRGTTGRGRGLVRGARLARARTGGGVGPDGRARGGDGDVGGRAGAAVVLARAASGCGRALPDPDCTALVGAPGPTTWRGCSGADLATVLRRLALRPDAPPAGLVVCDGSGTLVFRRQIDGFPLPRFGAACPLWPLYQALARPMTPIRAVSRCPGARRSGFSPTRRSARHADVLRHRAGDGSHDAGPARLRRDRPRRSRWERAAGSARARRARPGASRRSWSAIFDRHRALGNSCTQQEKRQQQGGSAHGRTCAAGGGRAEHHRGDPLHPVAGRLDRGHPFRRCDGGRDGAPKVA